MGLRPGTKKGEPTPAHDDDDAARVQVSAARHFQSNSHIRNTCPAKGQHLGRIDVDVACGVDPAGRRDGAHLGGAVDQAIKRPAMAQQRSAQDGYANVAELVGTDEGFRLEKRSRRRQPRFGWGLVSGNVGWSPVGAARGQCPNRRIEVAASVGAFSMS